VIETSLVASAAINHHADGRNDLTIVKHSASLIILVYLLYMQ